MTEPIVKPTKITNEEEAWDLFTKAIHGELSNTDYDIQFDNWPVLEISLKGEKYSSTLTAENMKGLIELQQTVNRTYAFIHYNTVKRKLTRKEKENLELVFKVSDGSSGIKGSLDGALQKLAEGMVNNMEPQHYIIIVLGAGLLWTGTFCWRSWLQHRKEVKSAELEHETRQFAGKLEKERMEIFATAMKQQPVLEKVNENAEEMYNDVLKSVSSSDSVTIAGIEDIKGSTITKLVRQTRSKSQVVQLNGDYRILKVDSSRSDSFKVEVYNLETKQGFTAVVQDTVVRRGSNKERLQQAEWDRKPVFLEVNARSLRGSITRATVIGVREAEEKSEDDFFLA